MKYKIIYGYYTDPQEDIIDVDSEEEAQEELDRRNDLICEELMWEFIHFFTDEEDDELSEEAEYLAFQEAKRQCESIWIKLEA